VLRVLTGIQTTSALVFSGFLSVHLVSPVVAAIGGVSAADKSLVRLLTAFPALFGADSRPKLLGRELYLPLEPILVYGPLAVHIVSSSLKRLVITLRARRAPPLTLSIVTGYLLVPFVLPHLLIHRIIPQSPSHPIRHLSPSELGFDFVAHAVKSRPVQSAGAYLGLVALVVPHAWAGSEKIIPWIRRLLGRSGPSFMAGARRKTSRVWMRNVTAALLGVIVVALSRLYSEGDMISLFMARRYEAVFTRGAPWERFVGAW
jgi:hypothetical protein